MTGEVWNIQVIRPRATPSDRYFVFSIPVYGLILDVTYCFSLVRMAKEPAKPAPAPGADILKLLTKAQTEFVTVSFYLMHHCIADCDVCF